MDQLTPSGRPWLPADTALWTTCRIVTDIRSGRVPDERVPTYFPLRDGEVPFAGGIVSVDEFRAAGDGSYSTSNAFAFGTGTLGLALAATTLAVNSSNNNARRAQAEADAQVTWRPQVRGQIVVTDQGFYLVDQFGVFPWDWNSIDMMQLAAFGCVIVSGRSTRGPLTWRVVTDWAELVFVLWATNRHPQHPQLVDGSWMPAGWIPWATAQGYPPALSRPELTP